MKFKHSYHIEFYIKTLNENYINVTNKDGQYNFPNFDLNAIHFEPYDFNVADGHIADAWIASGFVNANDAQKAVLKFQNKLDKIIEKISFVGQAFISANRTSFLAIREDGVAIFRYIFEGEPAPLMFMEDEFASLKLLLKDKTIPRAFYRFWNQAVNSTNYFGKLAMMFSAVDSFKLPNGEIDKSMREKIFGKKLEKKLYQPNNKGLRRRLIHGLPIKGGEERYWYRVNEAIIKWANETVLGSNPINLDVVEPHRNFEGNLYGSWVLLKQQTTNYPLELKKLLSCCKKDEVMELYERYESVHKNPKIGEFWHLENKEENRS